MRKPTNWLPPLLVARILPAARILHIARRTRMMTQYKNGVRWRFDVIPRSKLKKLYSYKCLCHYYVSNRRAHGWCALFPVGVREQALFVVALLVRKPISFPICSPSSLVEHCKHRLVVSAYQLLLLSTLGPSDVMPQLIPPQPPRPSMIYPASPRMCPWRDLLSGMGSRTGKCMCPPVWRCQCRSLQMNGIF